MHINQQQSACLRGMQDLLHPNGWAEEAQMPEAWRAHPQSYHRVLQMPLRRVSTPRFVVPRLEATEGETWHTGGRVQGLGGA